jgi:hypothetical protein
MPPLRKRVNGRRRNSPPQASTQLIERRSDSGRAANVEQFMGGLRPNHANEIGSVYSKNTWVGFPIS